MRTTNWKKRQSDGGIYPPVMHGPVTSPGNGISPDREAGGRKRSVENEDMEKRRI